MRINKVIIYYCELVHNYGYNKFMSDVFTIPIKCNTYHYHNVVSFIIKLSYINTIVILCYVVH